MSISFWGAIVFPNPDDYSLWLMVCALNNHLKPWLAAFADVDSSKKRFWEQKYAHKLQSALY